MTFYEQHLTQLLANVTYKDWGFRVGQDAVALYYLQVEFETRPEGGGIVVWTGRKWRISAHMTDSEIVQTALLAVLTAEEHEAREAFRYKGRAIFGPHLSVEKLWELTGGTDALEVRK